MSSVHVRVLGPDGKLSEARDTPVLVLSAAEWHKRLTPEQYRITRGKGTERAFCGSLLNNKKAGTYLCVCCNLPLFESGGKFESGTGWPSFTQPVATENIREKADHSHGMIRTEILCPRCGAHLGHVFDDGPPPTGRRYCLNSEAMRFVAADHLKDYAEPRLLRRRRQLRRRLPPRRSPATRHARSGPRRSSPAGASGASRPCFGNSTECST